MGIFSLISWVIGKVKIEPLSNGRNKGIKAVKLYVSSVVISQAFYSE